MVSNKTFLLEKDRNMYLTLKVRSLSVAKHPSLEKIWSERWHVGTYFVVFVEGGSDANELCLCT